MFSNSLGSDALQALNKLSAEDKYRVGAKLVDDGILHICMASVTLDSEDLTRGIISGLLTNACALQASLIDPMAERASAVPGGGVAFVTELKKYLENGVSKALMNPSN